ncbi:hypothetical protein C8R46DRAFT_1042127 [Mycena filopes]|nr:hypothetical protein C8R46DRAFT_1042127 [Mycena filopes]
MSKSDPGKILTIEVPARPQGQVGTFFDGNFIAEQRATVSTKRPASGSPSPASSEFDDDEERQEFVGSKVRLVESQDSRVGVSCKSQTTRVIVGTQVDVLRNQIKDLEQRKDRQLQSASNCVAMKAEVDPSPLSYQSALWESRQRFQESAKLLEEVRVCVLFGLIRCINRDAKARATNRDLHGQEQTAKGRHNELQATLQAASCQLQQLKESLRPLLEEQVVIPALVTYVALGLATQLLMLKCSKLVGYRGRVSKLLNEEQPKIQADWEAKLDGTMRRFQADHQRLDAEIHSLKTQESHTALAAQMPQVDAQVESQMVYYSKSAREQAQGVINRLSLEYQTAQAALARQEDTVSKEWEAKVDALDSELQGVLSTEQDLVIERVAWGIHGSQEAGDMVVDSPMSTFRSPRPNLPLPSVPPFHKSPAPKKSWVAQGIAKLQAGCNPAGSYANSTTASPSGSTRHSTVFASPTNHRHFHPHLQRQAPLQRQPVELSGHLYRPPNGLPDLAPRPGGPSAPILNARRKRFDHTQKKTGSDVFVIESKMRNVGGNEFAIDVHVVTSSNDEVFQVSRKFGLDEYEDFCRLEFTAGRNPGTHLYYVTLT